MHVCLLCSPSPECPSMRELHSELEEIHLLLNASRQQYEDTLLVVQRHTDDTLTWLDVTAEKYGWVTLLANDTLGPQHIFSITSVSDTDGSSLLRWL